MKRSLAYLAMVIIIAIAVFIFDNPLKSRIGTGNDAYFLKNFDLSKIYRVEIEQLLDGVILKRSSNGWVVASKMTDLKKQLLKKEKKLFDSKTQKYEWKKADTDRITSALGVFGGLEKGVIVSSNPNNRMTYQLGKAGLRLQAFDEKGKKLFDIIIGKNGPDFMSTYIQKFGDDDVYLVSKAIMGVFSSNSDDWVKKEKISSKNTPQKGQKMKKGKSKHHSNLHHLNQDAKNTSHS